MSESCSQCHDTGIILVKTPNTYIGMEAYRCPCQDKPATAPPATEWKLIDAVEASWEKNR